MGWGAGVDMIPDRFVYSKLIIAVGRSVQQAVRKGRMSAEGIFVYISIDVVYVCVRQVGECGHSYLIILVVNDVGVLVSRGS